MTTQHTPRDFWKFSKRDEAATITRMTEIEARLLPSGAIEINMKEASLKYGAKNWRSELILFTIPADKADDFRAAIAKATA